MSTNEKLPRVTSKIFASNAAEGDIGQFGSALTGTKVNTDDISVIQGLPAYETGWRSAVVSSRNYPTLQEMNGLQKTFSQQIAYILQNGMPEWDAGTTYFTDQFCRVGSMFYVSLQDNNLGNNPTTTTGFWQVWNPGEGTFANTDLSNLSATGQAVIDSKLSDTQLSNCILSLTEGSITPQSYNNVSFVNHGATDTSGVLSNFSASNFAILAKTMSNATAWTFTLPFITGADVSGKQTIVAINNKDNCVIIDNGAIALIYNGQEIKGDVGLSANTAYVLEFIRTTTGYTVNVKQADAVIDTITITSTAGFFGGKTVFLGNDQSGNYFKGSINLADTTIDENTNVYSADIVGSPTISSSGVISNLSTSNYLVIPYVPQEEVTSLEIEVEFTTDTIGARQSIFAQADENITCPQMVLITTDTEEDYGGKLQCLLPTTTGTWSTSLFSLNPLQANTKYKAKMTWDKTSQQHTLYLSTNGGDYVNQGSITCSEVSAWTQPMAIGVDSASSGKGAPFLGSINGSAFKITVNNEIVWQFKKGSTYWQFGDDIDCQTVEIKGNFQLLMPNGRAANGTMTNVTKTISLNSSLILYSPNGMGKTILVTEDNELMARDSYTESYVEPQSPALNSIWYDKTDNELKQQLNTFPNYSVVGSPTISNGVISNFASGSVQINQSFDLGSADSWEITIPVTTPSAVPEDYENIFYDYNNGENENENLYVIFTSSGAFQFRARRPDVYIVNNEVTVSTAYGVQTGDPEGENYQTGYVQTSGTAESYVTTGTQIYSDPEFETPLTTAPENTWTYTGQNINNTQLVTGYVKEAGVTLVPAQTTVYSDANCTSVQATASGADYTYSGDTAISYICTLSQSASLSTAQTIKVGFNGTQYYISVDENQQTYNSTDKVNGISNTYKISSTGHPFGGSINLNGLTTSLNNNVEWEWNGVSSTTTDFASFIGAKIGKITDDGTDITSATLDVPLTIAKDTDVVHNTGEETINDIKRFNEAIYVDKRNSTLTGSTAILRGSGPKLTSTPTGFSGCSIQSYASSYDITDETEANLSKAFGPQLIALDKNGVHWGWEQFTNSYYSGGGNSLSWQLGLRRYLDGVLKSATALSVGLTSSTASIRSDGLWFSFPKCNVRPTTTSSAATDCVDVIVKNYYSSTKGYVQFGSGLKIQWGRVRITTEQSASVSFPTAFATTNYNIGAMVEKNTSTSPSYTDDTSVLTNGISTGSVSLFLHDGAFNKYQAYVRWFAIGY